ncbi:UNVERIFIED_CONTAM: hypothetical protein Sradi_5684300, partial [Sesamum radiatum]
DYNEILNQEEKTGGPRLVWQINDFRIALIGRKLNDVGFKGQKYTWCNRRQTPETIRAKLDRACVNSTWMGQFPQTTVMHKQ